MREGEGGGGKGRREKREIREREIKNDCCCGRFHRSLSVRGVGCEEQEKIWTKILGLPSIRQAERTEH